MGTNDLDCNCQELAVRLAQDDLLSTSPELQEFLACQVVSLIEIERALAHLARTHPADSEIRVALAAIQIRTARMRVAMDYVEHGVFSAPTSYHASSRSGVMAAL